MGIGIQREACREVTKHTRYGFYVNSILQGNGCKGVAEVVEPDLWDTGSCQYSFEHIVYAIRRDWTAVWRWENVLVVGFLFLLFQNFYRLL